MTSRSPGKAPTTRAESDRHLLAQAFVDRVLGLSRHAGALCVVTTVMLAAMMLMEVGYFEQLSGGLASLDLRLAGFAPDEGMAWLTALGSRGSEAVIVWRYLTLDLVFPVLMAATLASLLLVQFKRQPRLAALTDSARATAAAALVLPYALTDYAQNICLVRLLSDVASANPDSLAFASSLVVAKFALLAVPLVTVAVLATASRAGGRT